jgi:hypothetical protein
LTIFEMLELLDTEIVGLRARNRELQIALERREQTSAAPASPKKKRTAKKKSNRKASRKQPVKKGEQLSLPALTEEVKAAQEARPVGKRLALGKSLVQLRRVAPRPL